MDFRQVTQPNSARPTPAAPNTLNIELKQPESATPTPPKVKSSGDNKWFRIASATLLIGIAGLCALIALAVSRPSTTGEGRYLNRDAYQAIFLTNGQVYFGNIDTINSKYIHLTKIYYLTQTGDNNNNYSLVKLGCQQVHSPLDAMVINRDQVSFWENIKSDGTVMKKINEFQKAYPSGPDCSQQPSTQTQASSTNTQGGSATTTQNTNSTTTTGSATPKQ